MGGIQTVKYRGEVYPAFQANGNAARFCMPFAKEVCKGVGLDIGCNRVEWCFPDAIPIDPEINEYHAHHLPEGEYDYIFSSHCLEHVPDWVAAIELWISRLKSGGVLFLYLPDYSQHYWRVWQNRKHLNIFTPEIIKDYLVFSNMFSVIFVSGVDAYNSFTAFAEKK